MTGHPCDTCPRWWECNGVAWDNSCPWNPQNWPEEARPQWPKVNPYIDEGKDESGLLEED